MEISIEDLQLIAQVAARREEQRRVRALDGDPRMRRDAIMEDIGRILASADMAIEPRSQAIWRKIIHSRMNTDPRFHATVKALLVFAEAWIYSERERCAKIARDTPVQTFVGDGGFEEESAWRTKEAIEKAIMEGE